MNFSGKHALAVSPEGAVTLPPALRKQMQAAWGASPELLCFGAQFFYLCPADQAETLLHRVDAQLCLAFAQTLWQVTDYLRDMTHLVEPIVPTSAGRFVLPREVMERLQVPNGGLLRLLGVGSHWELWNRDWLERQLHALKTDATARSVPLMPVCLNESDPPCSLLRGGLPALKRCGDCVFLRLP